jgi:hypothetical protein
MASRLHAAAPAFTPSGGTATPSFDIYYVVVDNDCQEPETIREGVRKAIHDHIRALLEGDSPIQSQVDVVCFPQAFFEQIRYRCLAKVTWTNRSPPSGHRSLKLHREEKTNIGGFQLYLPHFFAIQALMDRKCLSESLVGRNFPKFCGMAFLDMCDRGRDSTEEDYHRESNADPLPRDNFFFRVKLFMRNFLVHSVDDFTGNFGNGTGTNFLKNTARDWNFTGTPLMAAGAGAAEAGKAEIWSIHDLMTYIFTATPLAYVLPLCFKQIQNKLKGAKLKEAPKVDSCQFKAILSCIPPANPDMQAHSELDWYFDYDLTLRELVDLTFPDIQSRMRKAAIAPSKKQNRFSGAPGTGLRNHFALLLECFHRKMKALQVAVAEAEAGVSQAAGEKKHQNEKLVSEVCFCIQDERFASSANTASAWLGFGETEGEDGEFHRRPVCIRNDPFDAKEPKQYQNYRKYKEVMRSLNPSGYISSAIRSSVLFLGTSSQQQSSLSGADKVVCKECRQSLAPFDVSGHIATSRRWVYEVGICTLEELFATPAASAADVAAQRFRISAPEKETAAFRSLLREVQCPRTVCSMLAS